MQSSPFSLEYPKNPLEYRDLRGIVISMVYGVDHVCPVIPLPLIYMNVLLHANLSWGAI